MNPFYNIGKCVRDLRMAEGWTQQELADRVNRTRFAPGIRQPHIAGIEKSQGDKLPSAPLWAALAEVFGVTERQVAGIDPIAGDAPNLLRGLSAEDRAIVIALVSRLHQDAHSLDEQWAMLSRADKELEAMGL